MLHTVITGNETPYAGGPGLEPDPTPALRSDPFVAAIHPRILNGNLSFVPLPLLLRTVAGTGRAATILFPETAPTIPHAPLTSLRAWGAVALNAGRFLDARFGEHCGTEALVRLLLVRSGEFETWHDVVLWPVHHLAGHDLDAVLAEASATLDTIRELGSLVNDLDTPLSARPWKRTLTPRSFLLDWQGAMREGIDVLAEAVSTGTLEPVAAASAQN